MLLAADASENQTLVFHPYAKGKSFNFGEMKTNKQILVTGGAGYIGAHTVVELLEAGFEPIIVDDFRNSSEQVLNGIKSIAGVSPQVFKVDITNFESLEEVFKQFNFDGIIHFAAYKAVGESVQEPLMYYHNNLIGLINCLQLAEKYAISKFVFSSSCTVYGEPESVVVNELSPVKLANSPYGATKQMCERILEDFSRSGKPMSILSLRYFNPVGAHPSSLIGELPIGRPNNLLPYVTQTGAGVLDELTVFGNDYNTQDGTCIRDYIHVVDLAIAHVKGLGFLSGEGQKFEVVNVGTGVGTSVLEIIQAFEEISDQKLNWKFGPRRPGDVEQIFAEVTKAKELLNWQAKFSMRDAVRDAWNWEKKLRYED